MQFKKGQPKLAGRKKGTPNKSTQDIKRIIQSTVDFNVLVAKLYERARAGNDRASTILFEYGFGRPTQTIHATINTPGRDESRRALDEIFGRGKELAVSPSGRLVSGQLPVQDTEQSEADGVQHSDSVRGNGKGSVPG